MQQKLSLQPGYGVLLEVSESTKLHVVRGVVFINGC